MIDGLEITVLVRSTRTTEIALTGELGFSNARPVRARLTGLVDAGCRRLVLDASALSYCDTSGLALLLSLHTRLARAGGVLEVRHPHGQVQSLLARTCTEELLCGGEAGHGSTGVAVGTSTA